MEENLEEPDVNLANHCYSLTSTDFGTTLSKILCDFERVNDVYTGYIEGGIDKCNSFFRQLHHLGFPFVIRTSLQKKITDMPRLFFSFRREYFHIQAQGAPFCILTHLQMECVSGPSKTKPKPAQPTSAYTKPPNRKWKKIGCPAKLTIRVIRFFPEYAVKADTNCHNRKKAMNELKEDYINPDKKIMYRDRVFLVISNEKTHTHPPYLNDTKKKTRKPKTSTKYIENKRITKLLENIKNGQTKLNDLAQMIKDVAFTISNTQVLNSVNEEMEKIYDVLNQSLCDSKNSNTSVVVNHGKAVTAKLDPDCQDLIQAAINQADLFSVNNELNYSEDLQLGQLKSVQQSNVISLTPVLRKYKKNPRKPNPSKRPVSQLTYVNNPETGLSQPYEVLSYVELPIESAVQPDLLNHHIMLENTVVDQCSLDNGNQQFILKYIKTID